MTMPFPPRDTLCAAADAYAASDHGETAVGVLLDAVYRFRASVSQSEIERRESIARVIEDYAVRVERACPGIQATRDALVAAHDHADQVMWGATLPWPMLLMIAMLPAGWRDQLAPMVAAATHPSYPRRLTLRPGNWVRLTDAAVAHLRLRIGDVMVTDLREDGTVILQSLCDWCDQLDERYGVEAASS